MNRFSLYGLSGLRVDVVKATNGGFRVCVMVLPGGDEMWESLTHTALLTKPEADRLRDAIVTRRLLDLDHWVWTPSRCTPFAQLQAAPSATLQSTPYVPRF